jgi:hypothetical protein
MFDTIEQLMQKLPPLGRKTNPGVAAFWGFMFGGIALGIYFRSFIDFVVPLGIAVALTVVAGPIGWLGGALCATFWGYFRSQDSNERRLAQSAVPTDA